MDTATFKLANGYTPLSLSSPNFILPEDKRPFLSQVPFLDSIPIINMNEDPESLIKKVSQACEEYGFFQVINHGVSEELCTRMMNAVSDFFDLPAQERATLFTDDKTKPVRVSNYHIKGKGEEKVTMWSETFSHPWHPVDEFTHLLPQNPPQYRYFSPVSIIFFRANYILFSVVASSLSTKICNFFLSKFAIFFPLQ
ncbi:hypothetical protein ACSBR2_036269 [Camellia fascicularis]